MQPCIDLARKVTGYYIAVIAGVPHEEGKKDWDLKV